MKTYLNVLGLLGIVGGVALAVIERNGAWLGAALLPAGLCWGLARIIEIGEAEAKAAEAHRKLEVEYWKLMVTK